jgi:uncharacterized protein YndB with AHSA1/START domain
MEETGYCELRLTRTYHAAPEEVWATLTEPTSLARWLAPPGEIELVDGGVFEVGAVRARVREIETERVLELDWQHADEDPSIVRFELRSVANGTQLVLDHRRVREPVGMKYMARWTVACDRFGGELGDTP